VRTIANRYLPDADLSMPELEFINIGRGSLAYRSEFDADDPLADGNNPLLSLGALLGPKLLSEGGKLGAKLWETTGGKLIKGIKAGSFGKGTKNASEAAKTIETETIKDGDRSLGQTLGQKRMPGETLNGKEVLRAGNSVKLGEAGEKVAVKETGKVGAELLTKEGEKVVGKFLGKKIPFVCLAVGGYCAWDRFSKGDWLGGLGEIASAGTAMIPGFGTGASLAIDGVLGAYDGAKAAGGTKTPLPPESLPVNPFGAPSLGYEGGVNAFSSAPQTSQGVSASIRQPATSTSQTPILSPEQERHDLRAFLNPQQAPGSNVPGVSTSLLAKIKGALPSPNLGAYLPASLRGADWGGIRTARAAGREQEAVERFKGGLNVAALSSPFRQAIRTAEREQAPQIPQLEQEEQTVAGY
jgi:hypothetical protein